MPEDLRSLTRILLQYFADDPTELYFILRSMNFPPTIRADFTLAGNPTASQLIYHVVETADRHGLISPSQDRDRTVPSFVEALLDYGAQAERAPARVTRSMGLAVDWKMLRDALREQHDAEKAVLDRPDSFALLPDRIEPSSFEFHVLEYIQSVIAAKAERGAPALLEMLPHLVSTNFNGRKRQLDVVWRDDERTVLVNAFPCLLHGPVVLKNPCSIKADRASPIVPLFQATYAPSAHFGLRFRVSVFYIGGQCLDVDISSQAPMGASITLPISFSRPERFHR